jgi:hypothetical protein
VLNSSSSGFSQTTICPACGPPAPDATGISAARLHEYMGRKALTRTVRQKLRTVASEVGTGRQKVALERWTKIPNVRVVRVHVRTGYTIHRVEGVNRRGSRNGRVSESDLPPDPIRNSCITVRCGSLVIHTRTIICLRNESRPGSGAPPSCSDEKVANREIRVWHGATGNGP